MMSGERVIAVGVGSDGQVWSAHFGMAPWYYVYDREGTLVERQANPYAGGGEKHHDDPQRIAALLPECRVFIARRMGATSREQLAQVLGISPVLTQVTDPDQAVSAYLVERGTGD